MLSLSCSAQESTTGGTENIKIYDASTEEVITVDKINKSDEEWKQELTPEEYNILRKKGTERAFTGKYYHNKVEGTYLCKACGTALYTSDTKYDSGSGWPSFYDIIDKHNVEMEEDHSLGMARTEIKCARCGSHLGHVFDDGPNPTGLRYCVNSASLEFKPADEKKED